VVVQPFELTSSAINKRLQNAFEWMVFIERVCPMPPNQQETSHVSLLNQTLKRIGFDAKAV
jgi:hypothetical protein